MNTLKQSKFAAIWQDDFAKAAAAKLAELGAKNVVVMHDEYIMEAGDPASEKFSKWMMEWFAAKAASMPVARNTPVTMKEWSRP